MTVQSTNIQREKLGEIALMRRIAAHDNVAFEEFDRKYRRLIFSTALKSVQNKQDAEDITNEVLLKVWKKAASFHGSKGSLATWICTITRNRSIDHVRSQSRRVNRYETFRSDPVLAEKTTCGLKSIYRIDSQQSVEHCLDQLSDPEREVVELIYLLGKTQQETAESLQRPLGTVKAQARRAITKMRQIMLAR